MRAQTLRRHVAPEMIALSVAELVLTFTLALILMTPTSASLNFAAVHFAITCSLTVCFTAFVIGLYRPQMFERAQSLLFSSIVSALFSFPAIWVVSKALGAGRYWPVGYDSLRPLKVVAIWCVGVLSIRLLFLTLSRFKLFVHRVAIVGLAESPSVSAVVRAGRSGFLEIVVVDPELVLPSLLAMSGIRTIVLSTENRGLFNSVTVKSINDLGMKIQSESDFWERYLRRVDIGNFEDLGSYSPIEEPIDRFSQAVSRVVDLFVSLVLLVATLPIMLVMAFVILLDSAGTVLYRQERVGLNGVPFTLLKFRSMKVDAEASGPRWAQQKDPRVTRVGSFMRRTRIDELPQLLNILRGEMSFIGPRPERPHFVGQLNRVVPKYHERSKVKPGLTGWAQVNYPYGASVEDARAKLSYDLYYVRNRTVLLDIIILLSTIRVILFQEGSR